MECFPNRNCQYYSYCFEDEDYKENESTKYCKDKDKENKIKE